mgnify:CR=1 FL=1
MPGSWEIFEQRRNRVLVCILRPPDSVVSDDREEFTSQMVLPPGSDRMPIKGMPYDAARNHGAKFAVDKGYGYIFFFDNDSLPVDHDIVPKLMATNLPFVSAIYWQKFYPHLPVPANEGTNEQGEAIKIPITGWQPGQIVPATFVPTGALLLKRSVLEEMFSHYPEPFKWGVSTGPVYDIKDGQIEQVPGFSEDFLFSFRAKQLGIQPMVHTGVAVFHELRAVVGPRWLLPLPHPDPSFGIVGVR